MAISFIVMRTEAGGGGCAVLIAVLGRAAGDRHTGHFGEAPGSSIRNMVCEHSSHVLCPFWQHVDMEPHISMHTGHWRARRMSSDSWWISSLTTVAALRPTHGDLRHDIIITFMVAGRRHDSVVDAAAADICRPPVRNSTASLAGSDIIFWSRIFVRGADEFGTAAQTTTPHEIHE